MKILYVCADRGVPLRGVKGASVHVRAITRALARIEHDVTLAIATEGAGNPPPEIHRIELLTGDVASATAQLEALIEHERIDVVLERYSLQSGAAAAAARARGLALLLEVNAELPQEAARYRGLADLASALEHQRCVFASADAVQVVSKPLEGYVRSVAPAAHVEVIPNGVDCTEFAAAEPARLPLAAERPVIGFVGSMKPWHGLLTLLEAFSRLATRTPAPLLVIAGTGPDEDAVRARASRADLSGRVLLTGAVAHAKVPRLLRAFDVAVAPYTSGDDFYFSPLKIFEYMAAGRPVVHPDIADLSSIVGSGGLAYPAGDVTALSSRLAQLIDDARLRRRLGAAAATRAQQHDWQRVAHRVASLATVAVTRARSRQAPASPR